MTITSEHLEHIELGVVNWVNYARWGTGLGDEPKISAEVLAELIKKPKGMKRPTPAAWLELVRDAADSLRADGWLESSKFNGVRLYEPGVPILKAMEPRARERQPVILSYGMGVDSTAILTRWLLEPWSRDFGLEDLVVLTAQTGDESLEPDGLEASTRAGSAASLIREVLDLSGTLE